MRATLSDDRLFSDKIVLNFLMTLSPAGCPYWSLIFLNLSKSNIKTLRSVLWRWALDNALLAIAENARLLRSPLK